MSGIGIVNNPRSRRNRRLPGTADRLRRLLDGEGEVADAATLEELDGVLRRFHASGVDVLGVNGGDGTGHVVLTAAAGIWGPGRLPAVLLLRGDAMNTVAHGHRIFGPPEAVLARVLERRRAGRRLRTADRDLLRVEAAGLAPRLGFIFGTGAVVAFLEAYYATGRPQPATAVLLLGRAIGSVLARGRFAARITQREWLRVTADGDEWPEDRFLGVLASTTPEIGFGFSPFWRFDEQPGFFHALGVVGGVGALVSRLPAIYAGRPWRRSLAVDAVARSLALEPGDAPLRFTVDGDLYEARGPVTVRTGPPVPIVLA